MLSQEELKQSMDKHLAGLIVEQLAAHMEQRMQEQWDTVVFELASNRKTNEALKKTLVAQSRQISTLPVLMAATRKALETLQANNRKAAELLKVARKELGFTE